MRERLEPILRACSVVLAVLLIFLVARVVVRSNPLAHLKIPALPTLSAETNAAAAGAATNAALAGANGKPGTNVTHSGSKTNGPATNAIAAGKAPKAGTNSTPAVTAEKEPAASVTTSNTVATVQAGTNAPAEPRLAKASTNSVAGTNSAGTNLIAKGRESGRNPSGPGNRPPGMPMMGPGGRAGATPAPELPLPIRARVYQITDSEILGPVMRPMPMALLGIAGDVAFLRSTSGQSGMVKQGDSLGSLKLLQIGINRVLVEEDGQKKELTIFSGYGSETLLPKEKETSR